MTPCLTLDNPRKTLTLNDPRHHAYRTVAFNAVIEFGGKEKLRGEERLNYLSTYLHCLPLIFSKFSRSLHSLDYIFTPQSGNAEHKQQGRLSPSQLAEVCGKW